MNKNEFYRNARNDIPGPLSGVRVLEATTTWAGPMCAAVLADLGADVIKVEIPSGDVGRAIQPNLPGTDVGFMHATVNRNKRGLSLDTRTDAGRDIFLKLAESSDILVENFKVGTMAKYGLGYDQLSEMKPDIVYVSITGWGQFGPNHEAAGYDPLAQASSGCMSVNGSPDGPLPKQVRFSPMILAGFLPRLGQWRRCAIGIRQERVSTLISRYKMPCCFKVTDCRRSELWVFNPTEWAMSLDLLCLQMSTSVRMGPFTQVYC